MRFLPTDLTDDRRLKIQNEGLKQTVAAAFENSPFYMKKILEAGIQPEDVNSVNDLQKLPFTDKEDLQEGYPFPLRSVPFSQITRIHASSGTTGKRKILCYTQKDVDDWADMFARCYELAGLSLEDRVQIAVGYGLWTAGAGFQAGCERFGAMAIPVGPANAEMHCEMMVDLGTTVFCSTASMALLIAEEIYSRGIRHKIKLQKIIIGAERHSDAMRSRIKALTGVEHIFDIYGLTELYGPGTGLDCPMHQGIHFWDDRFIFEIIDPNTLERLPDGTHGELVVTTLYKEASPLIRYRTHDVTRILPGRCPCGSPFPRHGRIMGRTDDMFIYRAVNIYPSQIDHIISGIAKVGSEYQIHLRHKEDGRDTMTVLLERSMDGSSADDIKIADTVMDEIRRKVLVRTRVEMVDYGSLPRTQRKSQRVFDHRSQESQTITREVKK